MLALSKSAAIYLQRKGYYRAHIPGHSVLISKNLENLRPQPTITILAKQPSPSNDAHHGKWPDMRG